MRGDELSLVEAAQVGDVDALDELMTHYRGKVISMVRSILGNCHDAEDACQETMLAASQGLSKLQSRDKFGSWLLGTQGAPKHQLIIIIIIIIIISIN